MSACGERGRGGPQPDAALEAPASGPDLSDWTPLIQLSAEASDAAVLVGADGDVHAAWITAGTRGWTLLHASFPSSRPPQVDTVVHGWAVIETPRLLAMESGLLAVFVGDASRTASPDRIYAVEIPSTGSPGRPFVMTAANGRSGALAVVTDSEGEPVLAWPVGDETHLSFGMTPRHPPWPVPGCCGGAVALARDADGEIVVGGTGPDDGRALQTMTVLPADDATFEVPSSSAAARNRTGGRRFAITGLQGTPGVYMAYCAGDEPCSAVDVWRHGAQPDQPSVRIAETSDASLIATAPAREDRLWIAWVGRDSVHALRARVAGDVITPGPPIGFPLPASATTTIVLSAGAHDGMLNLVLVGRDDRAVVVWMRRVLPALAVSPPAMPPPLNQDAILNLLVEDAGDPLVGARVHALGREAHTDARGIAQFSLPAGIRTDTLQIRVDAAGYTPLHIVFHGSRPEGELP